MSERELCIRRKECAVNVVLVCHSVATEALKHFLEITESTVMLQLMEKQNTWPLFDKEDTSPHAMLHVARALAAQNFELVEVCVEELSAALTSVYDTYRITVVAFYSEVRQCVRVASCSSSVTRC